MHFFRSEHQMKSGYYLGVQAQFFFLLPNLPHLGRMEYLRQHRSDVYPEDHLDRYEQLFDILMIHTIFGMGALQSVWFLTFLTIDDVCIFRCTCFAVGVELHDVLDDMDSTDLVLRHAPTEGQISDRCVLQ